MMLADQSRRKCGFCNGVVSARRPRICTGAGYAPRAPGVEARPPVWSDRPMTSRRLVSLVVLLAVAASGCGFFDKGADAREAAEKFATALQKGDVGAIAFTDPKAPKE